MEITPLEDYLEYYKSLVNPGFAVLVTGEWGTGKTFQVEKALHEKERYYVSLFGLQSVAEIHTEILLKTLGDNGLAKLVKPASKLGTILGGKANLLSAVPVVLQAAKGQNFDKTRALVFDDLERSSIPVLEILGTIDYYIEQLGCKVIIIANDDKIETEFKEYKEKIIGQTIKIDPRLEQAFDAFTQLLQEKNKREFVNAHQENIIGVFKQSGEQSLRILRHVIEDIGRLFEKLDTKHLENKNAMSALVSLLTALNVEFRAGNLEKENFTQRGVVTAEYDMDIAAARIADSSDVVPEPPLVIANNKYQAIDLADELISDELLTQFFIHGRYDQNAIQNHLNNSVFFLIPDDEAPWKAVINFDKLEDSVVEEAVKKMDQQYSNREVSNPGEMLHIFMLRIMMVQKGLIEGSSEEEVKNAKTYIDDVLNAGNLPVIETNFRADWEYDHSHGGHGYWGHDANNAEFKNIYEHLLSARKKALAKTFPKETIRLMKLMNTDSQAFMDEVSHTHRGNGKYETIPILSSIPAAQFVETWLEAPKEMWPSLHRTFRNRYRSNIHTDLKEEQGWVLEVGQEFQKQISNAKGFESLRIKRSYEFGVEPIVNEIAELKAESEQ